MIVNIKNYNVGPYRVYSDEWIYDKPPMKWLPGDIINAAGAVESRNIKSHINIVGVIDFLNKTGQGFSPRGIPLYLFYPYDNAYPPFIVASKQKYTTNKISIINYEHWDDKWPRGGIVKILGDVGNIDIEREAQFHRIPHIPKSDLLTIENESFELNDSLHEYIEFDECFNIDPDGCEDADDIFAWRSDETKTEFIIGIADVSAFFNYGSLIDNIAKKRGQTIYDMGIVKIPMLPPKLSTKIASLLADGNIKPIIALVFSSLSREPQWKLIKTHIKNSFTYNSFINYRRDLYLQLIEHLKTFIIPNIRLISIEELEDTHKCVEIAMIAYNYEAAKLLCEKSHGHGILRKHNGYKDNELQFIANKTGCSDIKFIGMSAGEYVPVGKSAEHCGLGLSQYTHASSPLRRYADLINQRIIKSIIIGSDILIDCNYLDLADSLNRIARLYKSIEMECWTLYNLSIDTIQTTYGYCIKKHRDWTSEHEVWKVYIPAWKKSVKAVLTEKLSLELGSVVNLTILINLKNTKITTNSRFICSIDAVIS